MCVVVGDVDAFVTYPISDCNSRESHFNQQGYMTVSKIMDPNPLDLGFPAPACHFPMQIIFCNWEDAFIRGQTVQAFDVVVNLCSQKVGHLNDSITLRCFWIGDNILAIDFLV